MIRFCDLELEGPFYDLKHVRNESGVYVILAMTGSSCVPLDVGEAGHLRTRLETHDREDQWTKAWQGAKAVAVLYCSEFTRMCYETLLREKLDLPCGIR